VWPNRSLAPDGRLLAVAGQNLEVVLYEVATGHEVRRWRASHTGWVNDLSFAPDGSLMTANDDGRVVTWDATTGSEIRELRVRPEATSGDSYVGAPTKVTASPDGTRIAVASFVVDHPPQRVAAYDVATGERLFDVDGDLFNTTIAWSPDGSTVATGGWQSGRVSLLDAESGAQTLEPAQAAAGFVLSLGFAWDGGLLVTGGTDGTVRLFDTHTLRPVGAELPAPIENEGVFAFVQPSGGLIAVQSAGRILSWDLDPKRWAAQACSVANRQLTESEWRAFLPDRPFAPSCSP
jgi:WD40 repeat protein